MPLLSLLSTSLALHTPLPTAPRAARLGPEAPRMALKLDMDPEEAARLLEDGPAASQGPFGKGGALEWVADGLDALAEVTLAGLHRFDDEAVQDSSKNLQVLWSRAVLAKNGELDDPIAFQLLPKSTRGVVEAGLFDFTSNFLEWVAARTVFLNEGTDNFLSSPACADGKACQIVIFGAGFDTRSIRYQREGLQFFEVDLPDTIEAKRVVHERYRDEVNPEVRLPERVGFDLNDCEHTSLLDKLEAEHGFRRDVPTMFISEAVMFYVNPKAIAALYDDIFTFGQKQEAMYCFTDSMRPLVAGPFSDEISRFLDDQNVELLSHTARWSGAVQFMHAVARTPGLYTKPDSLLEFVRPRVEPPMTSYAPERVLNRDPNGQATFNNSWYAICYTSELQKGVPYATRLFGEPLTLDLLGEKPEQGDDEASPDVACRATLDGTAYTAVAHQGLVWLWRGSAETADRSQLPTHPTPEATHTVETILDYGCDWSYIVENNLDTPHLYWLHDGSIPPIESLGCNRQNIASIGLRLFTDDVGVGHIGKTSKKVTKVVRYDAPNVVRHGGVSGFSEEFNIVPIGPHRTRVLLRQRFPKGPILSTLLKIPGTRQALQYLVRNWNYQIGLEDYCVMQGQAHNIDDLGAPNWEALGTGDDLIVRFWKWKKEALKHDGIATEWFTRWDGSKIDPDQLAHIAPVPLTSPTHGGGRLADASEIREDYVTQAPAADYPPVNYQPYPLVQELIGKAMEASDLKAALKRVGETPIRAGSQPATLGAAIGFTVATGFVSAGDWLAQAASYTP